MTDTLRAALEAVKKIQSENNRALRQFTNISNKLIGDACKEAIEALAALSANTGGESAVQQAADVIRAERIRQQGGEKMGFVAYNWGNDFAHALDMAGLLASSPAHTVQEVAMRSALKKLVMMGRTTGGTAGRDQMLCEALEEAEAALASSPVQEAAK